MKKFVALVLTVVLVMALGVTAFAGGWDVHRGGNENAPNHSSGGRGVQAKICVLDQTVVEIRGNGNSARIWINNQNSGVRPDNNRWTKGITVGDVTVDVFVRGNAILEVRATATVYVPYVPTIVEEYSFRRYVRTDQLNNLFINTTEVEGSRRFAGSASVGDNWTRGHFEGISGMAVAAGATVTGTLSWQYNRNYVERFIYVYEYVDVVVWSNGDRFETLRPEFNPYDAFDGAPVVTGPFNDSRAINVTSDQEVLHMGWGQGLPGRTVTLNGAFTVTIELLNTGSTPDFRVNLANYDVYAM